MRRSFFLASATALGLVLFLALSTTPAAAEEAVITVQPNTLALNSLGGTVSVHTDIDYSAGAPWTATLNGLPAYLVKSDLCGNVVAKFDIDAVKAMAESTTGNKLTVAFVATPDEGEAFTGTDTMVITVKFNKK